MMYPCRAALSLALLVSESAAADWAVLVAASFQYDNYRHQADVCHAYHVLSNRGIPDSNIIVMLYDDVVTDEGNPFFGKLYNTPTGEDVYAGCKKDYTQRAVSAKNFLSVITGDSAAVPAGMPVLKSTSEDNVFIFYADHGATGFLAFPESHLYAADLNAALVKGRAKGLWRKAVFYVEACEAGSMFDGVISPDIGVYVVTASNPTESSWGVSCPPYDQVTVGTTRRPIGSCLGDLFAISWMNDTLAMDPTETLDLQYTATKARVAQGSGGLYPHSSEVMQYGDVSFVDELVSNFQGAGAASRAQTGSSNGDAGADAGMVPVRDIPLHLAYYRYLRTEGSDIAAKSKAAKALRAQLDKQIAADELFLSWGTEVTGDASLAADLVTAQSNGPSIACGTCCPTVHDLYLKECGGYDGYSIQYARLVANICEWTGGDGTILGASLVKRCGGMPTVV